VQRKILVVDDNPLVLGLVGTVLKQAGYEFFVAEDGAAGLERFHKYADEIGLIISVLMMPRMNGMDMSKNIWRERPDAPIVFMSGYSEELLRQPEGNTWQFLQKPFTPALLLQAVERYLPERT
jgi:two-component system cell cycle sensor histidine kinase/response regulator CckA